jgi:YidC/Oxa1 family membrane protein insertase
MQPQVPLRNYVLFAVCLVAILFGWPILKTKLYPPPPPVKPVAHFAPVPTGSPWTDMVILTAQYLRGPVKPVETPPAWDYQNSPRKDQDAVLARMVAAGVGAGPGDAVTVVAAYRFDPGMLARLAERNRPSREVVLGGAGYAITATLTDRGAGVRELVLNDFPAADAYGLPERNADGSARPVVLVPRTDAAPAFAVYHYATPDDKEKQPLDTLGRVTWSVQSESRPAGGRQEVVYTTDLPDQGVRVVKAFSLAPGEYHVGLSVKVERLPGAAPAKFRYQLAGASGLPIEGVWYTTTYRNALIGMVSDKEVLHRIDQYSASLSHTGGSDRIRREETRRIIYAAVVLQYFASAIAVDDRAADGSTLPPAKTNFVQFARATVEASPDPTKGFLDDITVRAVSEPVDPAPGAPVEHRYVLYHGPTKVRQLARLDKEKRVAEELVDRYADSLRLKSLTDYGNFGWWTDLIIVFTNLIHRLVGLFTSFLPAGLAVIGVTVIVRGLMFPISKRQAVSMQRMQERMAKLGPEMKEIEKKYRDDFMAKQQAQRELYRRHGVNPAASLGGCFMLILQMPIFMGLYFALQESVFFRLEPFLWIRNLTAPDMLLWWGEKVPGLTTPESLGSLFYIGPYLNLLPLLGAFLIFVQQKMAMPAQMTDEQRQQYTMMKYMTVVMAFMFYRVPAGLSLYFIASSLWGLTERKLVKRHLAELEKKNPPGSGPSANGARTKGKPPGKPPTRLQVWWEKVLKEASKK